MDSQEFKDIVEEEYKRCCDLLSFKEERYSDGKDRLIQFKLAAAVMGTTSVNALAGMMVKHTTKLYSMIKEMTEEDKHFTIEDWNEILGDHINYLFLLRAVLIESGVIPQICTIKE